MAQSPLNYTGGKYKLLPQLLPLFPRNIDNFIDLFCGGCNVGINVEANFHVYNDYNKPLMNIFRTFKKLPKDDVFNTIHKIIANYHLSDSTANGYEYYGCESAGGLGDYNRQYYSKLRDDFNNRGIKDDYYYIMLYVLIVYAFNNQIRFNSRGGFNLPIGKRDFNVKMRNKLNEFIDVIKEQKNLFMCSEFTRTGLQIRRNDFVYCDPPYLVTCASYNEAGGWNEACEVSLLRYLDSLHNRGIRFGLSNVLRSKGKTNNFLIEWLRNHKEYRAVPLNFNYSNSSYHTKDRTSGSEEVLVVNYDVDR